MIVCPYCNSTDIEGRGKILSDDKFTWRRKKCYSCNRNFKTVEIATDLDPRKKVPDNAFILSKLKE